jgi:MYXO-CTERM domain-containing protein
MRAAVIAALVLASSVPASAFVCTRTPNLGPSVFWQDRDVVVRPHGGGYEVAAGELVRVASRGTTAWTAVGCSDLIMSVGETTVQETIGFNWHAGSGDAINQNVLLFRNDTPGDALDQWVHTLGALAITTVTFDSRSGRLVDADIEINDASFAFTTCDLDEASCRVAYDLENTLTHELGHVLGLDHPPSGDPGAFEATMFASTSEGAVDKRDLADDDIAGVCTLYPAGTNDAGECYGVGRPAPATTAFRQTCASGGGGGPVPLLLLGALWRTRPEMRRRARRSTSLQS